MGMMPDIGNQVIPPALMNLGNTNGNRLLPAGQMYKPTNPHPGLGVFDVNALLESANAHHHAQALKLNRGLGRGRHEQDGSTACNRTLVKSKLFTPSPWNSCELGGGSWELLWTDSFRVPRRL
jgi:hypothetical protein